jgi:survival-of-motor-neuron-related-splicing factor 30
LYPEDGKYYQCVIEKITEAGYYVKFKKYNHKEVISLFYLREPKTNLGKRGEDEFADMTEFKAPEHLRVLPNDTMEERNKKKKKIKHLKQRWKASLVEKDLSGKMGKWGDFNVGAKETKKGYFMMNKNRQSIFKSPDGVDGKVNFFLLFFFT